MKVKNFLPSFKGMGGLMLLPIANSMMAQQRPNIVYIMTDDHTAQMMSCYGNSHMQTPNLDRIAQEGVLFRNSFVANSLSGPSRACMITGKHSHKNGFTNNEHGIFDGSQQTMPKLMQAAGYQTALIGKWHLVSQPTGFDYYEILHGQGEYYNPNFIQMDGSSKRFDGYCTDVITDKAINWIEHRDESKPFIIFVHHKACHRDWLPDMKYIREFEDQTFEKPANFNDNWEGRVAAQQQEMSVSSSFDMDLAYDNKAYLPGDKTRLSGAYVGNVNRLKPSDRQAYWAFYDSISCDFYRRFPEMRERMTPQGLQVNKDGKRIYENEAVTDWKFQRYMRDYAKVTKSVDDNVGRLFDYLKEKGMLDNTLVVYTSDQGFYMGEHGWFDKRFMYEESLNTPLVMRLPDGYKRRGEVQEMVQNIDYAPTFLEMAGVKVPGDIQGESLVPLLKGEKTIGKWRDAIYYHFYEYPAEHSVKRHYGIRTNRYKLIHFYNDIDTWELYDLKEDPSEMHNVYGNPAYAKVQKDMHKKLKQLQKKYDDNIEATL